MAFRASGHELWVGNGKQYTHLRDAVAAASDGDTIYVQAGLYENDFSTITDSVRIVGVGGKAHFENTLPEIGNDKAILITRADIEIENLEFSGARVADRNGAGIRFESGSLRVENSYFHDNENGILAGNSNGRLTVAHSEFAHNGRGDGFTHGLYVGEIDSLTVTDSYFHDTRGGHHIKSRADETRIIDNRLIDGGESTDYNIDLPNGHVGVIRGNVIEQSASGANRTMVHYGGESSNYSGSLLVEDNEFISHADNSTGVRNQTPLTVRIEDNSFHNVDRIASGPNTQSGNADYDDLSHVAASTPDPTPDPEPSLSSLAVRASGDDYNGDPRFQVYVDGKQLGATTSVTADHDAGAWQTFDFTGDFGADGPDEVAVRFINDGWGGDSTKDRNLYVDSIELDGVRLQAEDAVYKRSSGATLDGTEKMSWNGSLVFDTDDDHIGLLGVASGPTDDGTTG